MEEETTDVMSRLDAALADEAPEAAPDERDEQVEDTEQVLDDDARGDEQAEEQEEQQEEQQEDRQEDQEEELVDIVYEGDTYKVPPKLRDAFMREADYTRKTQDLAQQRKIVADRQQYLEAKEVLLSAAHEEAAEVRALQKQLEQMDAIDWSRLAQQDMQQAYTLDLQRQDLRRQLEGKQRALQQKVAQVEQARKLHEQRQQELQAEERQRLLESGRAELRRRIGKLTDADARATWQQGVSLGFSEDELNAILDPRVMHAIYKAAKWDSIQQSRESAKDKVSKAPPFVKAGASKGANQAKVALYQKQRQALKRSGRIEDAVAVLNNLIQ